MTIFKIASIFFAVFTVVYAAAAAAVIYHLRQYTLSEQFAPKVALTSFTFLSLLFWLLALSLLFKI